MSESTTTPARLAAEEIMGFLFDDYPDNEMNRGEATDHVAAIISQPVPAPAVTELEFQVANLKRQLAGKQCRQCGSGEFKDGRCVE